MPSQPDLDTVDYADFEQRAGALQAVVGLLGSVFVALQRPGKLNEAALPDLLKSCEELCAETLERCVRADLPRIRAKLVRDGNVIALPTAHDAFREFLTRLGGNDGSAA